MRTPYFFNGSTSAFRAASSLRRPIPRRPSARRLQKVAFMAPRCAGRPGVPASTSRNGASARTCWLVLRSMRPTAGSSVCASSSSTASGRLRQRAASRAVRVLAVRCGDAHSTDPTAARPSFRGSSLARPAGGARTSTRSSRLGTSSGVTCTNSTPFPRSRQARSNQWSSAVLPLPRGPVRTTLCGGARPPARSARHPSSTSFSRSRPVSAGGTAPSPGVNTRCVGTVIG